MFCIFGTILTDQIMQIILYYISSKDGQNN